MSAPFKLSLPVDIPWEQICVSHDMMDRKPCDLKLPSKWQSSMAVYKYVPEDDYQNYPGRKITYVKVTATITGYQPRDAEIQGNLDWSGLDVTTLAGITALLESYYPCHGAILKIAVGPQDTDHTRLKDYPFIHDFEPKKRELFEMATDTHERASRSLESLNISNSAGTTRSLETMDIDMGGSTNVGIQGSYAGAGRGINVGVSNAGQWGTRSMNTDAAQTSRTTDLGQEKRETFSHATQLSQMYHLLDSYHLGTNRAVFFVQPRPHVLEEPSGFVKGPRPVEGIQGFFLVVSQPEDADDFCVPARLDTSHLVNTDILDYTYRSDISNLANASARLPNDNDEYIGNTLHAGPVSLAAGM